MKKTNLNAREANHSNQTMNTESAVIAASILGTIAFKEGRKAVPAHDKKLMSLIAENSTGMGWSIPILKAWSQSWHAANLSNATV